VRMYVCGVTVYDDAHIGHAMSAIVFDVVRRYLEWRGYAVRHVVNFTDVDDKIINRANERGISSKELAETFIRLLGGSWELAACPGRGLFWIPRRLAVVTVALLYVLFTRAAPIRVERGPEGDTGNTEEDNARQRFETNRAR